MVSTILMMNCHWHATFMCSLPTQSFINGGVALLSMTGKQFQLRKKPCPSHPKWTASKHFHRLLVKKALMFQKSIKFDVSYTHLKICYTLTSDVGNDLITSLKLLSDCDSSTWTWLYNRKHKVDNPYLVAFLIGTPMFEKYSFRFKIKVMF